ncbi:cingulin-like protein 1 [Daktulosphaira vitifoliae]|uniref:cingulin-like protein 1 n=1 Tax=Daktulosphaira vitifoliae TaxID=58002 RepID=UPI0021AA8C4B|nr:cingulin-like protein 1 [Daktulosphaira vitifoliae]XP_050534086.1 cingulin-like protein 1 [Daktulosphaira vitifoliae]
MVDENINCDDLVLTTSDDQFVKCHELSAHGDGQSHDCQNSKNLSVVTLGNAAIQSKNIDFAKLKQKNQQKAFNAKFIIYKNTQKYFISAADQLIDSHAAINKLKNNIGTNNSDCDLISLQKLVMGIVTEKFGIEFSTPKKTGVKKIHSVYIPNLKVPQTFDLHSIEQLEKVISPLILLYDDLWRKLVKVTDMKIKYLYLLRKIMNKDEFHDLDEVTNYLSQNGFEKEPKVGDVSINLEKFHGDMKYKLETTLRELEKGLDAKIKSENVNKKNIDTSALETKISDLTLTIEKLHKENKALKKIKTDCNESTKNRNSSIQNDMANRVKILEEENKKLRSEDLERSKQLQLAKAEISFHKSKLNSAREQLVIISKEKTDLIDTIGQIEVKEEGLHSLKARVNKLISENDRLRTVMQKIDENEFSNEH